MLDFFGVITKGGLVLWYFQDAAQHLNTSIVAINALIRNVILQERGGLNIYNYDNLALKSRLDNQFDLLYVVVYQKILQLSYVDKFLSAAQREFRDKFKEPLEQGLYYQSFDFSCEFERALFIAEEESKILKTIVKAPRSFEQSGKSQKTVDSMIQKKGNDGKPKKQPKKKEEKVNTVEEIYQDETVVENEEIIVPNEPNNQENSHGSIDMKKLEKMEKIQRKLTPKASKAKSPKQIKKGKENRIWELDGRDSAGLDYSNAKPTADISSFRPDFLPDPTKIGTLKGHLQGMDENYENEKNKTGGVFSLFRGLVGGKTLSDVELEPVLEKLKDHLISKNVANDIAIKLCESVNSKLQGKHLGTFEGVASLVRTTLNDALVQLLTPKRRLDILRDVTESKSARRPYIITFCGVNGVGKSTNLAKISFWLIENNFRVLIAACDTFRAGAVEQLRTHMKHLNALHPPSNHAGKSMVELYEQGYGKDAADIARHSIEHARKNAFDVVLVDTAGRMQDNEPLMRALAKLIHVNEPDLTLFVGEALVGNEAVDQLVKFNRALANYSSSSTRLDMIDGIVLTKFDTIDDKVGAAISMTYITGQPIVFVGTGQTYTDLKNLDPKAVVHALMK